MPVAGGEAKLHSDEASWLKIAAQSAADGGQPVLLAHKHSNLKTKKPPPSKLRQPSTIFCASTWMAGTSVSRWECPTTLSVSLLSQ